jgi:hypothetical protein
MKTKLLIVSIILASAFSAFANNDKYRLILVDDPATTITVAWNQISGTNPTLHYDIVDHGSNFGLYAFSQTEDRAISYKGMDNRFVRLTGLTPNTNYYFVLNDSEGTSQRFWFRTAPNDNSRLSFISGGDSRNNQTPRQKANLLVSKLKPHAIFFGGDMTDTNSGPEWAEWFDDWQLTTAIDGRMFPIIPAMGNHEYDSRDPLVESETIYNLFDTAENSYYAVTFGAGLIRAYTLNTQISVLGNQRDWLANDLSDTANTSVIWKMAQYHRPMRPHTKYKAENNFIYNAWAQLFYDEGVRLVVDCDSHTAKTTWPVKPSAEIGNDEGFVIDQTNGTVYTGEGCWGAPLRDNNDDKSWTRNSGSFNQFKLIFVEPSKIELRTIVVNNADLVGEVSNTDPFTLPVNLDVFSPSTGAVVTITNLTDTSYCPASGSPCDDGDANTILDEADGSCNCIGLPDVNDLTELNIPVATSTDDAEEIVSSGAMSLSSTDLELIQDTNDQIVGVRFNNIQIPDGATLYRAYIQFQTDEIADPQETTNLVIHGELTSSSETFNSAINNISSRALTTTSVSWNALQEWSYVGEAGVHQRTSNLKDIVEEITALPGWNYGNALTFIISGSGKRVAESEDGGAAPILKLFYKSNCPISSIVANAQTPCDYADNTFTQDLTVTYNDAPATGTLDINGQSFAIATSPQTVTLTLDSNSNEIDVTASFSDDNTCIFTAENLFSAPSFCDCPISSIVANSQSLCNPLDNTYIQEVTVTYNELLAIGTLEVNGQSFITGTSPQTVTLTNLDSNSNDIDVTAYFSGTTDCEFTAENLFSAPSFCNCPISSIVANSQTACNPSDNTYSQDITVTYNESLAVGTLEVNGQSFITGTSPQTVTLTNLDSNSNDIDVTAYFSGTTDCVFTAENLFSAPNFCNCPISSIVANSQTACNPSDNTYSQDITVTYNESLAIGTLEVNGQSFITGTSPQTVTLTNLDSNSNEIDVTAYFSGTTDCVFTAENLFNAPSYCNPDMIPNNVPDDTINLALLPEAGLSGSVSNGRGTPLTILYDPLLANYREVTTWNEYGVTYGVNLGTPDVDNGFKWQVNWPGPKYINYITFGGSYDNQPQPNTMWRISYRNLGNWTTLDEGQGGWIDSGIYEWGGGTENPIEADAIRVQLYSDGSNDVIHIHLRGRGGTSTAVNDSATTPKATLIQYLSPGNSCGVTIPTSSILYCGGDWLYSDGPDEFSGPTHAIIANGTYTIGVDKDIEINNLEISSGATVIVKEGASLTVKGDLVNNGTLILESISTKYSSLIVEGTSTGDVSYKRHVNAFNGITGNDLVSSPLSGQNFGSFAIANPNLFENPGNSDQKLFGPFNETSGSYQTYFITTDAATILDKGIGFRAARDATEDGVSGTTLTFTGQVETAAIDINITETPTSFTGWNLIGNPYTSYIDFETFFNLNKSQLSANNYQAIYGYDGDASDGWTILNNLSTGVLIAPGQGFFVKAKANDLKIDFTPDMRVKGTTDDFILGRSNSSNTNNLGFVKLQVNADSETFSTAIHFNSNATLGLDPGYDAALFGGNAPAFSIYSNLAQENLGVAMAIQALDNNDLNSVVVSLGIHASQGQDVTVSISEITLPNLIDIYLEDTVINTFTLLNDNNYTFTPQNNLSGTGRFYLRFENGVLSTIEQSLENLTIYTNAAQKTIVIEGQLQGDTDYRLYDLNGRIIDIKTLDITRTNQSIDVAQLSIGIYIVELTSDNSEKRIQKVIIQ